jgi:hydrogenase maturation protein HypF
MMPESWLEQYVDVSPAERERLLSSHRPIVVVKKGSDEHLAGVAPGLHTVGVMLPYSGLHHLLFAELDRPLVMTSANLPGRPMLIENEEIAAQLRGIADHYLLHNRRIVARCDDSVQRYVAGRFTFLRRSRGLVPEGLERDLGGESILALGPESDLAFALYDRGWVTASQHIGNVDDLETLDFLHEAVRHLQRITKVRPPEIIVCDAHPQFLTTQWAEELATESGARRVSVQHHVAHLLSLQLEHHLERAVGIVLDGYGYGLDGQAWGGEILVADAAVVSRAGSLGPTPLPGGDLAAKSPLRVAASLLVSAGWSAEKLLPELCRRGMTLHEAELLLSQIDRGVNAPLSTSAGRFLDAVAAWTGICRQRTYEGEPAMQLEASAIGGHPVGVPITIREEGERLTLDIAEAFAELVHLAERASAADVAATAQEFLAQGAAELGLRIARAWGISSIGLSGGVAYNDHIASRIRAIVEAGGFDFYTNELFPCGDGGLSIGQAAYAGLGYRTCETSGETRIER